MYCRSFPGLDSLMVDGFWEWKDVLPSIVLLEVFMLTGAKVSTVSLTCFMKDEKGRYDDRICCGAYLVDLFIGRYTYLTRRLAKWENATKRICFVFCKS
jgi:hypothetical protein